MLVLGIETATSRLGLALWRDGRGLAELELDLGRRHCEKLLVELDGLLADLELPASALSAIAVSQGPGSFTGLRIGLAFAKGLALALGCPLAGVPTLAALAAGAAPWEGPLVACLDARRGEVYFSACVLQPGGEVELGEVRAGGPEDVAAASSALGSRVLIVGEGAAIVRPALGHEAVIAPPSLALPRAAVVAALGAERLRTGGGEEPDHVEPIYVRRSDAEIRRGFLAGRA